MGTLGTTGYGVKTFAEYKTDLQNLYRTALGAGVNLAEQSPQGIIINGLAEMLADGDLSGLDIFNGLNLDQATGIVLSFIAILRGTERQDGTEAVLNVTLTSNAYPYTIPANTQFKVLNSDLLFQNETAINVTGASQAVQLVALENGETSLLVGDKLQSQVYIPQLQDITITAITDGTDDETDNELRDRLQNTSSPESGDDIGAIYTALLALDNVSNANVFENDTSGVDADGRPPRSIECVVLGDTDQNVVNTIFSKKPAGTTTYGSSSGVATDTQGFPHTINFTRPAKISVYTCAVITAKEYDTVDSSYYDTIRSECAAYVNALKNGQNVSYTTIFGIFAKYNAFDISHLYLSVDDATWQSSNLSINTRQYPHVNNPSGDIHIQVV